MTNNSELKSLSHAAHLILETTATKNAIAELKQEIQNTTEPFVWSVIEIAELRDQLPPAIQSGWIFVLKRNVSSGAHYHPNSIQHMVLIEGSGRSNINGEWNEMKPFGWSIIPQGTPHEFFPRDTDMVVISFHTCSADLLEEIACETGHTRRYEQGGKL